MFAEYAEEHNTGQALISFVPQIAQAKADASVQRSRRAKARKPRQTDGERAMSNAVLLFHHSQRRFVWVYCSEQRDYCASGPQRLHGWTAHCVRQEDHSGCAGAAACYLPLQHR